MVRCAGISQAPHTARFYAGAGSTAQFSPIRGKLWFLTGLSLQVMKLLMEKEARARRILMRRINQEKEELVFRLRANGAQLCILRCWREYKKRKEDKRKEEERLRRKAKAESERRKAEAEAAEKALLDKKKRAERNSTNTIGRAPSRTESTESMSGMYASVSSLTPGAFASRTPSMESRTASRDGSLDNSFEGPMGEGAEEAGNLVAQAQIEDRFAMI